VRRLIRSFGVFVLAVVSTVVLAGTQTMMPLVALTATALIMGGTGHPLSTPQDTPEFIDSYTADANNDYILLTGYCGAGSCTPTAVSTPEQFMPVAGIMPFDQSVGQGVGNLDQAINAQPVGESMVVFGYSQSARIASIEKANLAASGSTLPLSFVLIGNPSRLPESLSTGPHRPTPTSRPSTSPVNTTAGPTSRTTRSTRSPPRMPLRALTMCMAIIRASVSVMRSTRAPMETPTTT
jgi:hypothetical protein